MYDNVRLWKDEEGYWVVPIPKEYEFDSTEMFVNELGGCITISPEKTLDEDFDAAAKMLGPDFMSEILPLEEDEVGEDKVGEQEADHGF